MKYLFILVIFLAVGWGLYYEGSGYERLSLITSYWEISKEEIPQGYSLVFMKGETLKFFQFETANGFVDIAKHFWIIGALIVGAIAILLPLSIYTLKSIWNWELSEAKQVKADTQKAINKSQQECDLKVNNAYDTQLKIVQNELSQQLAKIKQREAAIASRENEAERKLSQAQAQLEQYRAEFSNKKSALDQRESDLTKQRDNAIMTLNARRMKFEKKEKKLKRELKELHCNFI